MEKKLLLLGFLRNQEMHGYQLNEVLAHNTGTAITLKKSNAYRLLQKMEDDGWITHHEEQEGNRPRRRVYAVTPQGEAEFQRMLRVNLATFPSPEYPAAIGLNYVDLLPADETVSLMRQRREQVQARFQELDELSEEIRQAHLGIEYLHRCFAAELVWTDEIIRQLNQENTG